GLKKQSVDPRVFDIDKGFKVGVISREASNTRPQVGNDLLFQALAISPGHAVIPSGDLKRFQSEILVAYIVQVSLQDGIAGVASVRHGCRHVMEVHLQHRQKTSINVGRKVAET